MLAMSLSKSQSDKSFYVYVYIDPRSLQEFYYGKGQGDRKDAHRSDDKDSEKTRIIKEIENEGLEPIVKVIAKGLTEDQAFLIEKTLIWKLGRTLTNKSSGHFAENFRAHNTLHKDLHGFDFENGVYCINIGEGPHRTWNDSRNYSFISAGQSWKKYGSRICSLRPNDILCGYLSEYGYVGIARVIEAAVPANIFLYNGKALSSCPLERQKEMFELRPDPKDGEFVLKVEWLSLRDKEDRIGGTIEHWRSRSMLGSLEEQKETLKLLEKEFNVTFSDLLFGVSKTG